MPRNTIDSDNHIGRRIKLRDLQIMQSVAQFGSMAVSQNTRFPRFPQTVIVRSR